MDKYIEIESMAPTGWFSALDMQFIEPYLESIPENGIYVEIGVFQGRSLWFAEKTVHPSVNLFGVDLVKKPKFLRATYMRSDSWIASHTYKDVYMENGEPNIDVLFIDGDHSYEGVKRDIENWAPFVKSGGKIVFHDCDETSPGVVKAFDELIINSDQYTDIVKSDNERCSMAAATKK